ncbi:MAG TPA: alpha-amylase family glycosyl hydrolase [Saprospiraceae bacterium]|nr:alpha-amylase family glycosyl hydrolase [Saprospiraceae bacterium]
MSNVKEPSRSLKPHFPRILPFGLIFYILLLFSFLLSCSTEEPVNREDPSTVFEPKQYGTPFSNIPEIPDIQLYEVNPQVFSSARNLAGITLLLDSLKELGINVVWIMPIFETGQIRSVGSPYSIKDYLTIHPSLGNKNGLRQLVDKAHSLDMAVILDWVANHTAWDHPWMQNTSWYIKDGSGAITHPPGTNWLDVAQLDFTNMDMRLEMIKAMKYWILEANVDGYRFDYAAGPPANFWKQSLDTLRSIPGRNLILFAEDDEKSLLNTGFDLIFGWPFYGSLLRVFNGQPAQQIFHTHLNEYQNVEEGKHIVRWTTNHDEHAWDDIPQNKFRNIRGSIAAFVIASHLGGVPLIYNGQEVAVPYPLPFFEGHNTSINWTLNPGIKAEYKRILNFRKHSMALRRGSVQNFSSNQVSAFLKKYREEELFILVNVRNSIIQYTIPEEFKNSTWKDVYSDSTIQLGDEVALDPYEYLVLKK